MAIKNNSVWLFNFYAIKNNKHKQITMKKNKEAQTRIKINELFLLALCDPDRGLRLFLFIIQFYFQYAIFTIIF